MQLRRIAFPFVVSLACSGFGCKSKDPTAQGAPSTSPSPTSVTSTTVASASASGHKAALPKAPWLAIPTATSPLLPNMGFSERFEIESKSRPAGIKPNVEEVFGALEAAGAHLVDKKQHLASPFGARYCVGARAVAAPGDETIYHLSVCEFVSPEVAMMSRDYSDESLATAISNRSVFANKQTTLTLREMNKTPENDALGTKLADAYKKLDH
jgi:hypothetical protein